MKRLNLRILNQAQGNNANRANIENNNDFLLRIPLHSYKYSN